MAGVARGPTGRDSDPPTGPSAAPPPPTSSPTAAERPERAQTRPGAPGPPQRRARGWAAGEIWQPAREPGRGANDSCKEKHRRLRLVYCAVNHLASRTSICRPPSCSAGRPESPRAGRGRPGEAGGRTERPGGGQREDREARGRIEGGRGEAREGNCQEGENGGRRGGQGRGGGRKLSRGRELWGPFCHSAKAVRREGRSRGGEEREGGRRR